MATFKHEGLASNGPRVGLSLIGEDSLNSFRIWALSRPEVASSHIPLEILIDPFLANRGDSWEQLLSIVQGRKVSLMGRGLSIGSTDPLDLNYILGVRKLADELNASSVGDYLAWTGVAGRHIHALMPVIFSREMIEHLKPRIQQVQDLLGRTLHIENTVAPVSFRANNIPETDFLKELADTTGCQLALNLTTLYQNSLYQDFDPEEFLHALDFSSVSQIKISVIPEDQKTVFGNRAATWDLSIWSLLSQACARMKPNLKNLSVTIRDEVTISVQERLQLVSWAELIMKEVMHGSQGSAGISPASIV